MNFLLLFQDLTDAEMAAEIKAASMGWTTHLVPIVLWLIVGVALITIIMSLINMLKNPGALKNFAIGIIALAVIVGVFWAISPTTVPADLTGEVSPGVYQWIGAGLSTVGVLIIIGLVMLVFDLIKGILKF